MRYFCSFVLFGRYYKLYTFKASFLSYFSAGSRFESLLSLSTCMDSGKYKRISDFHFEKLNCDGIVEKLKRESSGDKFLIIAFIFMICWIVCVHYKKQIQGNFFYWRQNTHGDLGEMNYCVFLNSNQFYLMIKNSS